MEGETGENCLVLRTRGQELVRIYYSFIFSLYFCNIYKLLINIMDIFLKLNFDILCINKEPFLTLSSSSSLITRTSKSLLVNVQKCCCVDATALIE